MILKHLIMIYIKMIIGAASNIFLIMKIWETNILIYILMSRSYYPSNRIIKLPQSNAESLELMATKWESHSQTQYLIQEYMMLSFQTARKRSLRQISSPKICTYNVMQTEINMYRWTPSQTTKSTNRQLRKPMLLS